MKNWNEIIELMDNDIREQVHMELAPCTNEEFLARYLELDPEFESVLDEFSLSCKKMLYNREMLDHDYSEEAFNYVSAGMTDEEIAADVRECFKEYYVDDAIITEYIDRLMKSVKAERKEI